MKIAQELKDQIAKTVWLDEFEGLDGLTTAEVARKFGISTSQAYRELMKILTGKSTLFSFEYLSDYDGVMVSTGRIFVRNGEEKGRGKGHSYWFYT
jgi:hypothetical protein